MNEMREYGFYPATDAPNFNQFGGYVPSGFDLTMSAAAGTIYYTLDGSDPRLVGGAVNNGAASVYSGAPISITGDVTVRARAFNGGEWSALNEADFTTTVPGDVTKLRITELQYHPANFPGVVDDEDLEYIELLNTGGLAVSLDGVEIGGFASNPYVFDNGQILMPGERIVVTRSPAVFQSVYGIAINLAPSGYFDSNLSNGGESVILRGPLGQILQSFTYDDVSPWPTAPDGGGQSLEIIDPLGNSSDPSNWRASLYFLGSPGTAGLPISGDYDASGIVDAADYGSWKTAFGTTTQQPGFGADGNGDGRIDAADYTVWRNHLGDSTTLYGITGGAAGISFVSDSPPSATNVLLFDERQLASVNNAGRSRTVTAIPRSSVALPPTDLLLSLLQANRGQQVEAANDDYARNANDSESSEPHLSAVDQVFERLQQADGEIGFGI